MIFSGHNFKVTSNKDGRHSGESTPRVAKKFGDSTVKLGKKIKIQEEKSNDETRQDTREKKQINRGKLEMNRQLEDILAVRDVSSTSPRPLYHLRSKETRRYLDNKPLEDPDTNLVVFEVALELFNRKAVRKMKKVYHYGDDEISDYFYECVGKAKVGRKLCSSCRDHKKDIKRYDYYFIDLVEISQQRTILCLECMCRLLRKNISGTAQSIKEELGFLRLCQDKGVYINPFLISCGY